MGVLRRPDTEALQRDRPGRTVLGHGNFITEGQREDGGIGKEMGGGRPYGQQVSLSPGK